MTQSKTKAPARESRGQVSRSVVEPDRRRKYSQPSPEDGRRSTPKAYAAHDRTQAAFWWLCGLVHYPMCFARLKVFGRCRAVRSSDIGAFNDVVGRDIRPRDASELINIRSAE